MAQPVELEANVTDLNFENPYAELEAPSQTSHPSTVGPPEALHSDIAELGAPPHTSELLPVPQPYTWEETKELIIGLEHKAVHTHTLANSSAFKSYLAPGWKRVNSEGAVAGFESLIGWQSLRWRSPKMSDIFVLRVGENAVLVYYKLKVEPYHKPGWPMKQLRASTWKKEDGEWKMVFQQCTPRSKS